MTEDEGAICDACERHPATWQNKFLLGSDAALCRKCFSDWYENEITSPAEMKARRAREATQ